MLTAAVMTTSSGRDELWKCIEAVQNQSYRAKHYILTDGIISFEEFCALRERIVGMGYDNIEILYMSEKVGTPLLCGNRLYAGCVNMIPEDVVFMCDDDNFYDAAHVASLMRIIMSGHDWAFSLRKVTDREGNYVCHDDCESLGHFHPTWNSLKSRLNGERPDDEHMVDTSAYAFKRQVFQSLCWIYTVDHYGPDRTLYKDASKIYPKFACSKKYTLNYSIGSNKLSVQKDYFDQGNAFVKERHPKGLPWHEFRSITVL